MEVKEIKIVLSYGEKVAVTVVVLLLLSWAIWTIGTSGQFSWRDADGTVASPDKFSHYKALCQNEVWRVPVYPPALAEGPSAPSPERQTFSRYHDGFARCMSSFGMRLTDDQT